MQPVVAQAQSMTCQASPSSADREPDHRASAGADEQQAPETQQQARTDPTGQLEEQQRDPDEGDQDHTVGPNHRYSRATVSGNRRKANIGVTKPIATPSSSGLRDWSPLTGGGADSWVMLRP